MVRAARDWVLVATLASIAHASAARPAATKTTRPLAQPRSTVSAKAFSSSRLKPPTRARLSTSRLSGETGIDPKTGKAPNTFATSNAGGTDRPLIQRIIPGAEKVDIGSCEVDGLSTAISTNNETTQCPSDVCGVSLRGKDA